MATVLWRFLLKRTRYIGHVLVKQKIKAAVFVFLSHSTGFGGEVSRWHIGLKSYHAPLMADRAQDGDEE